MTRWCLPTALHYACKLPYREVRDELASMMKIPPNKLTYVYVHHMCKFLRMRGFKYRCSNYHHDYVKIVPRIRLQHVIETSPPSIFITKSPRYTHAMYYDGFKIYDNWFPRGVYPASHPCYRRTLYQRYTIL